MSEREAIESTRPIGGPGFLELARLQRYAKHCGQGIWVLGFAAKRLFSPGRRSFYFLNLNS
jgi:hypothetical protein